MVVEGGRSVVRPAGPGAEGGASGGELRVDGVRDGGREGELRADEVILCRRTSRQFPAYRLPKAALAQRTPMFR